MRMRKVVIVAILVLADIAGAQTNNTAPVAWERYRLADKVSVLLPKLPMVFESQDFCHEIKQATYLVYADGAVYEVAVIMKETPIGTILGCSERTVFGERSIERRLEKFRDRGSKDGETTSTVGGLEAYTLKSRGTMRLLISDIAKNKRWIELAVYHSTESDANFDRFFGSVETGTKTGKDVGKGSKVVLGDPIVGASSASAIDPSARVEPARIIFRPFPRMSDKVLYAKSGGAVKLKVELKANGTVGKITATQEAPHGMTKATIEACRQMIFLPMKVNGVPTDSTMSVDYSYGFNSNVISN